MNPNNIIENLSKEYPGKKVLVLPKNEPKEIICEVDPSSSHPEYSQAVAYILESTPHYHQQSTETYVIQDGILELFVGEEKIILTKEQKFTIAPKLIHWAKGNWTRISVGSTPGWTPEDHILISNYHTTERGSY